MAFHEKIQARMKELGIDVVAIHRRFVKEGGRDIGYYTLKQWIDGPEFPRFPEAVRIARILGLSLDDLADDSQ